MSEQSAQTTPDRPYIARDLTRRELLKEDIHSYYSPKERRLIRVIGLPNLAMGLQREFGPQIVAYVERPRILTVGKDRYEFAFWTQDRDGRESLLLLVPTGNSESVSGGRRRHRQAEALLAAAEAAHLPLHFVLETDLIEQRLSLASHIRMLPSVQLAARLDNRPVLRERILEFVVEQDRCRVSHIIRSLDQYLTSDVRCVVCDLIHAGLLDYSRDQTWNDNIAVWRTR